ncbi:MAG: DUF1097 domain-containing protein [Clostridia bacterium]|nr:DUF1097 domain-containing protein [Clostridia bacterium]
MTFKKYLPIALFIGVQAFLIQVVDQLLSGVIGPAGNSGFGWIAFQAWAVYFVAGCTVKGGIQSFISYVLGMMGGIVIFTCSGFISFAGFWSVPLVLLIIAPILVLVEIGPKISSLVPQLFIGCGAFFGCMSYVPGATYAGILAVEAAYCLIGLVWGWATVAFRGWYEKKYASDSK